jgi:hypothetical protein
MTIISISGEPIPEGEFNGFYEVIGASREECIESLTHRVPFARDAGTFTRYDSWTDKDGIEQTDSKLLYRMVGGTINA